MGASRLSAQRCGTRAGGFRAAPSGSANSAIPRNQPPTSRCSGTNFEACSTSNSRFLQRSRLPKKLEQKQMETYLLTYLPPWFSELDCPRSSFDHRLYSGAPASSFSPRDALAMSPFLQLSFEGARSLAGAQRRCCAPTNQVLRPNCRAGGARVGEVCRTSRRRSLACIRHKRASE
mmetsp:Transcript_7576/g.15042  ORF Transcript_7576/g.15042 Transcript_7576/m.15042 type:complete len:176 (-) Transcript_7576:198-725(-)